MPLHLFNDFIEDLWRDGIYKSENVDETIKVDPSIKEFISFSKTKSLYIMAIKNDSDAITGFVVAEFNNTDTFEHDEARDEEINTVLVEMIRKISPIVSNRYVFKKDSICVVTLDMLTLKGQQDAPAVRYFFSTIKK